MDILPLFPQAVLGLNKLNVSSEEILNSLKELNFSETEATINNQSLSFASVEMNVLKDLPELKKEIDISIKKYLFDILKLNMNYKFLNSWATKTLPNGFSQKHTHSNTFLSGVFYPKKSEHYKISFFKEEGFWDINVKEPNNLNCKSSTIAIGEDNLLILFPSDLQHAIKRNTSNDIRYSIAFNVNPSGFIGNGDTLVNF